MATIRKVGVAWNREFKNKKKGIKISIDKKIYIAYENTQKLKSKKDTDPDYVICEFIDEPNTNKVK